MSLLSVELKKSDSSIILLPVKHTQTHTHASTKVSELLRYGRFCHFNKWCHHKRKCSYHHSPLTSAGTPETHSCLLTWKILACFDKPDTTATHVGSTCKFTKSLRSSQIFIIISFFKPGLYIDVIGFYRPDFNLIVTAGSCWNTSTRHCPTSNDQSRGNYRLTVSTVFSSSYTTV